jgi:hypothetical protein
MKNPNEEIKICKDCGDEWSLTDGEKEFYDGMVKKDPTFAMPKRCPKCRQKMKTKRALERHEQLSGNKPTFEEKFND